MRDLERELERLGRELDYPEGLDLPRAVTARLMGDRPGGRRRRPRGRIALLAAVIVLAVAGAAAAARFALRGVFIAPEPTPAPATVAPPGEGLGLGRPVRLAEARGAVPFAVLLPVELGDPDGIFLADGRVSATYAPDERLPRDPRTNLGALFTQFRASIGEELLLAKLPETGTVVERVSIGDATGFWLEGTPHVLYFVDEEGEVLEETVRLAGNVLLWERDGVTYRLEADLSRDDAIAVASSL